MKKTIFKKTLAWVLTLMMVITFMPVMSFAEEGDDTSSGPAHTKSVTENEDDGTYTIALDVTGDSVKKVTRVNVVVVLDSSGSMDETEYAHTYTVSTTFGETRYGTDKESPDLSNDDDFFLLTRQGYNNNYVYTRPDEGKTAYVPTNNNNGEQYVMVNDEPVRIYRIQGNYTATTGTDGTQYGWYNNSFVQVYYNNGTWYRTRTWSYGGYSYSNPYDGTRYTRSNQNQNTWYSYNANGEQVTGDRYTAVSDASIYTGTRYTRANTGSGETRMTAATTAVKALGQSLLAKNGVDGNPSDTVEIALIDFDTTASTKPVRTTYSGTNGFEADVTSAEALGGTNWEAALTAAKNVDFGTDDTDHTYIIFVSDGNPTFRDSANGYTDDYRQQDGVYGTGQEGEANVTRCYNAAKTVADTITGSDDFTLYTIGAYGEVTRMEGLGGDGYYKASNTAELQDALDDILSKIEMEGIANVQMEDGTTSQVETTAGVNVNLLTVDTESFKYYRAGGDKYSTTANDGLGEEWEDAPPASFENGAVSWNLDGVLENEVKYTVTFKCAPSQYTYDLIADLNNGVITYDSLDDNIKEYFIKNSNGTYSLLTNTDTSFSYVDTRVSEERITGDPFEEQDPVATSVSQMSVTKEWENQLDGRTSQPVTMGVTKDGVEIVDAAVTLSSDNNWTNSYYIATGQLTVDRTTGDVHMYAKGHDYTMTEPTSLAYYWDLDIEIVRPMIINGTHTTLVKVEEDAPEMEDEDGEPIAYLKKDGVEYFQIDGNVYRVSDKLDAQGNAILTATNYRRSYMDITKKVNDTAAPADATFTYTLEFGDPGQEDLWFSVQDKDEETVYDLTTSAEKEIKTLVPSDDITDIQYNADDDTYSYKYKGDPFTVPSADGGQGNAQDGYKYYSGYYSFPSGTATTVDLMADWNLRVINLLTGSTYTVTETAASDTNFTLDQTSLVTKTGEEAASQPIVGQDEEVSGEIDKTNTSYTLTFTNRYDLGALKITKVITGLPEGTTIPAATTFTVTGPNNYSKTIPYSEFVDGEYTIQGLTDMGEYTVVESGADGVTDYSCTTSYTNEGKATISKGSLGEVTVTNAYTRDTGTLTVTKTFAGIAEALIPDDFMITINGLDDELTIANGTKSETGLTYTWTINDVETGDYTVSESGEAIAGYSLTTDSVKEAVATVAKTATDSVTAALSNAYEKNTEDVVEDDSVTINKVDEEGEALSGATFQLKDGETVVAEYTDQSFEISTDDADLADYLPAAGASKTLTLTESEPPAGYEGDSTSYDVVISASAEEVLDEENDVYVTTTTYTMTVGGEETLDVANTKKTDTATVDDSVTVSKVDQDNEALTGATFQLKDGETVVATYTDQSFEISTDDAELADYLPAAGASMTLTLTESAPPAGYTGDATSYDVVISAAAEEALDEKSDTFVTTTTYTMTVGGAETKSIVNTKKTDTATVDDSVTVSKVDQDNEALTGATFQLKDGETVVATYTDQSYEISTDDAELADYLPAAGASTTLTLTESAPPAGYTGDATSYDVVISATAEEALDEESDTFVTTTTYTMTVGGAETKSIINTKKTDTATVDDSVTVNKVDGDGKALSGATFQLKDGETVVATYTNQSFTIGTGDAALASYLPAAGASKTLTLTETKVPNGYEGDTASHNVVISAVAEEALDTEKDAFVTTTTYTVTIDGKEAANIVNNKKASPPPPDIPDEPIPLDLNGEDHFAYIEGYPDGTVQPEGNITRAEVTTMIYRLLTEDRRAEIFTDSCDYSDVEQRHWFNKAISSMTVGEYVTGYPHGIFKPNQAITRAEFVTIVVRFLEGERDAENPFTDIDGHWAQKYILSAVDAGWIDGYPDGTFKPNEPIKRCEAMKIMNTILHRGINEESELGEPVMFPDNADPSIWYYYEVIEATNDHETEGERPDEDWLSNECEYVYDIVKYERPDPVEPEGEGE